MKAREYIVFVILVGATYLLATERLEPDRSLTPLIFQEGVNDSTIGLYEKYEIRVGLQNVLYSNPYDPEQVDVRAVFTAPSGKIWQIFGFYDNYNYINQWKVRFSPNETGEWIYHLEVLNGDSSARSDDYHFEAIQSAFHGWIKVSTDNPHYLVCDDGTSFYGVGAYYPWGVSNGSSGLALLEQSGANIWGYWNISYGGEGNFIESLDSGLGRYDQPKCGRIDQLIEWSETRNLKMMLAIWPHDLLSRTVWAHQWDNNPYKYVCDVTGFFGSESAWRYQEKQYRYIIARWGYSRSMGIWEIVNEVNGTDGWETGHQLEARDWVARVHNYLTAKDPFGRPTTASMSGGWYWKEGYERVDLPNVHVYETGWPNEYPGNPMRSSLWLYHDISNQFWSDFLKPGIMGEAGYTDTYGSYDTPGEEYTTLYHNALWASWSGGLSMTPMWWSLNSRSIMSYDVMDQMLAFSKVARNYDYAHRNFDPFVMDVADCDAYGMKSTSGGFGWIREYYGKNVAGKAVTISGLQDSSYIITWYDTWSGNVLDTHVQVSVDGKLTDVIPNKGDKLPDIAFFIDQAEEGETPAKVDMQVAPSRLYTLSSQPAEILCVIKDSIGRLCGSATNPVTFSLTGPGWLDGPAQVNATNGIAGIAFRSDSSTGTARIVATSPGLQPDTAFVEVTNQVFIDDFEDYSNTTSLKTAWKPRSGTSADIMLETDIVGGGQQGMRVDYAIGDGNAPYAGFFKKIAGEYREAQKLRFWLKPDASTRQVLVVLTETDKRYWQYEFFMNTGNAGYMEIPLNAFSASDSSDTMDLNNMAELSLNVFPGNGGYGSGTIYLDDVQFLYPSNTTILPEAEPNLLPVNYRLYQNYPNPFNGSTMISYELPKKSKVRIDVYNIVGQLVEEITDSEQSAGFHNLTWNPKNLSSGIYIYQIRTERFAAVKKCVLLK